MRIERRFTKTGQSAYAGLDFRKTLSEIKNPDGSVVFRLEDIDVPAQFSAKLPPIFWRRNISARLVFPRA